LRSPLSRSFRFFSLLGCCHLRCALGGLMCCKLRRSFGVLSSCGSFCLFSSFSGPCCFLSSFSFFFGGPLLFGQLPRCLLSGLTCRKPCGVFGCPLQDQLFSCMPRLFRCLMRYPFRMPVCGLFGCQFRLVRCFDGAFVFGRAFCLCRRGGFGLQFGLVLGILMSLLSPQTRLLPHLSARS
jgi:hypothetical protein